VSGTRQLVRLRFVEKRRLYAELMAQSAAARFGRAGMIATSDLHHEMVELRWPLWGKALFGRTVPRGAAIGEDCGSDGAFFTQARFPFLLPDKFPIFPAEDAAVVRSKKTARRYCALDIRQRGRADSFDDLLQRRWMPDRAGRSH